VELLVNGKNEKNKRGMHRVGADKRGVEKKESPGSPVNNRDLGCRLPMADDNGWREREIVGTWGGNPKKTKSYSLVTRGGTCLGNPRFSSLSETGVPSDWFEQS